MCVLDPNLVNFPRLLGGHLHSDSPRQCLMFRPPIIDSVRPGSLVIEVKFQVGKLKTSPAELACCQDLRLKASSLPWCSRNGVKQMLSMITSQVVTRDADVTDVAETSRDSFEIFKVTACRSGLTWSSWVFSWGNGQSENPLIFCLYFRSWVARLLGFRQWLQKATQTSALRFCHSHCPSLYPFLRHRSTTSSVQLACQIQSYMSCFWAWRGYEEKETGIRVAKRMEAYNTQKIQKNHCCESCVITSGIRGW